MKSAWADQTGKDPAGRGRGRGALPDLLPHTGDQGQLRTNASHRIVSSSFGMRGADDDGKNAVSFSRRARDRVTPPERARGAVATDTASSPAGFPRSHPRKTGEGGGRRLDVLPFSHKPCSCVIIHP
ncbi:hypothetical protein AAFF_G00394490 [Aldrovandia affinis]|uniref:Uncharacterized protein n=1 Tax=Aldrovandia affinis TaxID=143900 RepID=A0AAD7WL39_9TELE|nr:hypothetical protein AAFF_G00394490 [Aldrovandia affinis]